MADPFDSDGLEHLKNLKIGVLELAWLQEEYQERLRHRVLSNMAEPGFIQRQHGAGALADFGWTLRESGTTPGDLVISTSATPTTDLDPRELWGFPQRLAAIDRDGNWLEVPFIDDLDVGVSVPGDGVWYTVVMRRLRTKKEAGTIDVTTSSSTITGVNTQFTRLVGKSDPNNTTSRGMLIRIDAADTVNGNAGTYEIDTVTDDTTMTIVGVPNGTTETDLPFSVAGEFLGTPPADIDIHNRTEVEFEMLSRIVGAKGADADLVCFDVMRTGGVLTIVDRRNAQMYRPIARADAQGAGYYPLAVTHASEDAGLFAQATLLIQQGIFSSAGQDVQRFAAALGSNQRGHLVIVGGALGVLNAWPIPATQITSISAAPTIVSVDASGTAFDPDILNVPSGYGITHIVVYAKGSTINLRTSADDGASWSGETVIWNPTLADPNDSANNPQIFLTRDLRLIVVAGYFDDSVGRQSIRAIWSDNLGDSVLVWDTNTNVGYTIADDSVGGDDLRTPGIVQDDGGSLFIAFSREDALHVVRGQGPNNPIPGGFDAEVIGAGYLGATIQPNVSILIPGAGGTITTRRPRLWAGPDGSLIVFFGYRENVNANLQEMALIGATVTWAQSAAALVSYVVVRRWDTSAAQGVPTANPGHGLVTGADGVIHLYYPEWGDTAGFVNGSWQPVLPVRCDKRIGVRLEP